MYGPVAIRSPLRRHAAMAFAVSALLGLAACDKNVADPPLPRADTFPVAPATPGDTSVPPASAVVSPVESTPAPTVGAPSATQSNTPMTPKQQSTAMPLGGQANDHSAPKPAEAAKAASAPKQ